MRTIYTPIACALSALSVTACEKPGPAVYDTPDSWLRECAFDYACSIADAPDGTKDTLRFEHRKEDMDGTRPTKSAELMSAWYDRVPGYKQNRQDWVGFRFYLDETEESDEGRRLMIAQTHGQPDFAKGESWRHPPVAITVEDGQFVLLIVGDNKVITPGESERSTYTNPGMTIPLAPAERGKWHNLVIHDVYNTKGEGKVEVWVDDTHTVQDNIVVGYNDKEGPYWKFGVYAISGEYAHENTVAYFDDVKLMIGQGSFEDVAPEGMSKPN
ncbi:polysaccharide lyase [Hyphomonas pacifica]|uniref:Alginate lyase 2 domain-containing protein n=1 Tax=Hyphomonas pacifica TaxID=1280941 RepID=A0A062TWN6_9PROT|nr:polysaccharide lyase [Hyphomonas pacifica]KCZ48856.1 hypothetical protein HY2_15650 [Hyphomonas pacifica]RAN33867.1 hypothetical protein HY3_11905 [Hyphomonas pacifica]RAN38128.1 hypothetical protein HY11_07640 [Hyphomonas pacifica]